MLKRLNVDVEALDDATGRNPLTVFRLTDADLKTLLGEQDYLDYKSAVNSHDREREDRWLCSIERGDMWLYCCLAWVNREAPKLGFVERHHAAMVICEIAALDQSYHGCLLVGGWGLLEEEDEEIYDKAMNIRNRLVAQGTPIPTRLPIVAAFVVRSYGSK
jgi:uncharacterized protein (DUF2237 family)